MGARIPLVEIANEADGFGLWRVADEIDCPQRFFVMVKGTHIGGQNNAEIRISQNGYMPSKLWRIVKAVLRICSDCESRARYSSSQSVLPGVASAKGISRCVPFARLVA